MRRVDATLSDRRKSVVRSRRVGNVAIPMASGDVQDDEENRDGRREVCGDEDVQRPRGQGHDHEPDDEDDEPGEGDVRRREASAQRSLGPR